MFLLIISLVVGSCLNGCTIPYVSDKIIKRGEIISIYLDQVPETVREFEVKDPRWLTCFDQDDTGKFEFFINVFKTCIRDNEYRLNRYFNLKELDEVPDETEWPFLMTIDELRNYKVFSFHCALSKYIEDNISNIDLETLVTDFRCRSILFWYVLSNEMNEGNKLIFKKFAKSIVSVYEEKKPDMFYCFNDKKEDLVSDMNTAVQETIFSMRNSRVQDWRRLPYGRHSEEKYETFVKIFLKLYFGANLTKFSLKKLNTEQKEECRRNLLPQIKTFYPNFRIWTN